jgi:hypothetical protein
LIDSGGKSCYIGLDGETYEGSAAGLMSNNDKEALKKRAIVEREILSPTIGTFGLILKKTHCDSSGQVKHTRF